MLQFEWPWFLCLLPVPVLIRYFMPPVRVEEEAALRVPFLDDFLVTRVTTPGSLSVSNPWLFYLAMLAWCLFILALMRPQWLGELVGVPVSGRDLMMAVDLSASMEQEDFVVNGRAIDRLTAVKQVAEEFIMRRVGDRIGLILFGEQAYLHTPLSLDREAVRVLLNESFIGMAGEKTAIGDAIGLAVKHLRKHEENDRVLLLLTDGANTAGEVDPLMAADLAAKADLTIYTIGIGADRIRLRGFFGMRTVNPSVDLDEQTLRHIAEKTGGRYFRARDTEEFQGIYQLVDELEPVVGDPLQLRPYTALYFWPLSLACALAAVILLLRYR